MEGSIETNPDSPSPNSLILSVDLNEILIVSTMTLATVGMDGEPHAAPVYFAPDEDLNLYFFSDPGSRHGTDFKHDPRAAMACYPDCQGWQDIRGVQMHGVVQLIGPGPGWERAWQIYANKFPFVAELKEVVAQNQLYVFIPEWIRVVDNRRGFGFKEEWVRSRTTGAAGAGSSWRRR